MTETTDTELTIDELTQGQLGGDGVFDRLMQSVEQHIQGEYAKSRIKATDYAQVYLGSLQSTLDQSIRFLLDRNNLKLVEAQIAEIEARTELTVTQQQNALIEKQKLEKEIELMELQKSKTDAEVALLEQKKYTEQAQTTEAGVDDNSVIGRQRVLYKNQAEGFLRDAEQKATRLMVDTWNVRRTGDPNSAPTDEDNRLTDSYIGEAVQRLLAGIESSTTT